MTPKQVADWAFTVIMCAFALGACSVLILGTLSAAREVWKAWRRR